MTAVEALRLAHGAGISVSLVGDLIRHQSCGPPPAHVLDALKAAKLEILALLSRSGSTRLRRARSGSCTISPSCASASASRRSRRPARVLPWGLASGTRSRSTHGARDRGAWRMMTRNTADTARQTLGRISQSWANLRLRRRFTGVSGRTVGRSRRSSWRSRLSRMPWRMRHDGG